MEASMIAFLFGLYFGGFLYVATIAAADEQCETIGEAILSAAIWPYGLYQVIRHLNGGEAL
jgi:hypothetical protein